MSNAPRLIVDEPIPGHFCWTLVAQENADSCAKAVDWANGPLPDRESATAAGLAALGRHQAAQAETDAVLARMRLRQRDTGPATI